MMAPAKKAPAVGPEVLHRAMSVDDKIAVAQDHLATELVRATDPGVNGGVDVTYAQLIASTLLTLKDATR